MGALLALLVLAAIPSQAQETTAGPDGSEVQAPPFVVIVNAEHPGTAIQRARVADIFLRKAERWGDGRPIEAADQSLRSEVRAAFSRRVLHLEPGAVLQYWQSQLLRGTGLRPPPVKKSDEEIVEWVGAAVGRIGYVAGDVALGDGVKAVSLLE